MPKGTMPEGDYARGDYAQGTMPEGDYVMPDGDYTQGGLCLTLHCHRQNDSCSQVGSDERYFNVSLTVSGKVTKTVSINHNF